MNRTPRFGEPVTNVCAGDDNPHKRGYFVRREANSRDTLITDKNGTFWRVGDEVVFPGHLDDDECRRLFAPIHAKRYPSADRVEASESEEEAFQKLDSLLEDFYAKAGRARESIREYREFDCDNGVEGSES